MNAGLPTRELVDTIAANAADYGPPLDRTLALNARVVAALVGPPEIGRTAILQKTIELHPELTAPEPAPSTSVLPAPRLIGVVTESHLWSQRFLGRYPHGSAEQAEQLEKSIACLSWMIRQDPEKFEIICVYNQTGSVDSAASQLHGYLSDSRPPKRPEGKILDRLIIAAHSMRHNL